MYIHTKIFSNTCITKRIILHWKLDVGTSNYQTIPRRKMGSNLVFCGVFFNSFIRTQLCLSIYILSLSPNTLKGQIWGRWYSLNKNCKVCKAEHVYYLAFYKEFASPLARLLWYFEKTPKYCGSKTRPYFFLLVVFSFYYSDSIKKHRCWQPPIFLLLSFCYPVV